MLSKPRSGSYISLSYKTDSQFIESRLWTPRTGYIVKLHQPSIVPNKGSYQPRTGFVRTIDIKNAITTDESRMTTFITKHWAYNNFFPMQLAQAGFYYRGEGTFVYCSKCHLKTDAQKWIVDEKPHQAHARLNTKCPFVIENGFMVMSDIASDGHEQKDTENLPIQSLIKNVDGQKSQKMEIPTIDASKRIGVTDIDGCPIQNQFFTANCSLPNAMNTTDTMNSQLERQGLNFVEFKYDQFKELSIRLKTFTKWKYETKQKGTELARAGFFYTGESDIVRCFCCDLGLAEWDPKDNPWTEHARHSPTCSFLIDQKGDCFVQDIQTKWKQIYNPKHAAFDDKESRISSFGEWRQDIEQTPDVLAEAGFFYTGEEDTVRCHYCDGGLRNWEPGDNPWEEHTRWFPFCKFVIKMKGREYIEQIRNQTERQRLEEDSARQNNETREKMFKHVRDQLKTFSVLDEDINRAINQFLKQNEQKELTVDWAMGVIFDSNGKEKSPFSVDNFKEEKPVEKDPVKLLETNRQLKEQLKCMRCKANDACMVFVNCGHRVTCESCANKMDFCLYCNKKVNKRMKTFLS